MSGNQNNTRKTSKLDLLMPFKDQILKWRTDGLDLRAIASKINAAGCRVGIDHNVISRFLAKHGILKPQTDQNNDPSSIEETANVIVDNTPADSGQEKSVDLQQAADLPDGVPVMWPGVFVSPDLLKRNEGDAEHHEEFEP